MPIRIQIALFVVLAGGAIVFLLFQSQRIRELEARRGALENEVHALEETAARIAFDAPDATADAEKSATQEAPAAARIPLDPDRFFAEIQSAMASRSREAGLALMQNHTAAIANADPESLKAVLARIGELPGEMQLFYVDMITRKLAVAEPAKTIDGIIANGIAAPHAMFRVQEWAARDPAGAIAWYRDSDSTEDRSPYLQNLVTGLAKHGSADALKFIASLDGSDRLSAIRIVASQPLNAAERREVLSAVEKLPGQQQASILQEIAAGMLDQRGFSAAATFVDSLELDDAGLDKVAMRVATSNLRADADAKGRWLLEHSSAGQKGRNLAYFVSRWAEEDFNAAGEFLNSLDSSAHYHGRAIASYARKIAEKEPPTAVDWAGTITQEKLRANTLTQVYRTWAAKDREAADGYFAEKGIEVPAE